MVKLSVFVLLYVDLWDIELLCTSNMQQWVCHTYALLKSKQS